MINLQKAIRDVLQQEFDKNTEGLIFDVSLYSVKSNSFLEKELPVGDTYAVQQKRFIPVLIEEINGTYANLQNLTAAEAIVNATFLVPTDETDFNNMLIDETFVKVSTSLDKMRERLISRTLPLGGKQIIKANDYELKVLNDTNMLATDYIEFSFKLLDDNGGMIVTDNDTFEFKVVNGNIVFEKDDLTATWTNDNSSIQKDVIYTVNIFQSDNTLVANVLGGGTSLNANIVNANSTYDDLVFGGSLMSLFRIVVGSNSATFSLDLRDFETYIPVIGSVNDLDTSGTAAQYTTGELGTVVFGFNIPNPTTNVFTMGNGLNYQQFELTLDAFITDKVFLGNDVKYYLDNIEIFPFFRDESFVSETDPSQVVGQQITKHTAVQSVLGKEYSIYLTNNSKLIDIAKKITSETPNPNEVYTLRVKYPLFEREYKVIITQGALGIGNNQPVSLSIKLDLASNILITT
jgi:hypothetical protein